MNIFVPTRCSAPPASACAYLADQFRYSQSSVNLLQAIEVPQGQVELVQESTLVAGRLGSRVWAQQVIGGAAERLPAKIRLRLGLVEKLADCRTLLFLKAWGLCSKIHIQLTQNKMTYARPGPTWPLMFPQMDADPISTYMFTLH